MRFFRQILHDRDKRGGVITTLLLHVLLLLVLLFYGLRIPEPLPEQGIRINFGIEESGSGDVQLPTQSVWTEAPMQTEENLPETSASPESSEESEEVMVQKKEMAPVVPPTKKETVIEEKREVKEPKQEVNPDALYTGKKNAPPQSSEGISKEEGDQGSIEGDPTSKRYEEAGGTGQGYDLSGRKILERPVIEENTQETGKVVVAIWVDRYGSVVRAVPGARGSTTTSAYLFELARNAAMKARFSPNTRAPEEQKGTIIFEFTLRR